MKQETDAEFHQEIEEERIETKKKDEIQDDEPSIEDKLKELKRLYTKKLISKSVYEEKQRQIMSDFELQITLRILTLRHLKYAAEIS